MSDSLKIIWRIVSSFPRITLALLAAVISIAALRMSVVGAPTFLEIAYGVFGLLFYFVFLKVFLLAPFYERLTKAPFTGSWLAVFSIINLLLIPTLILQQVTALADDYAFDWYQVFAALILYVFSVPMSALVVGYSMRRLRSSKRANRD